jgi:hypothetical protein
MSLFLSLTGDRPEARMGKVLEDCVPPWLSGPRPGDSVPPSCSHAPCAPLLNHAPLAHEQLRRWYQSVIFAQ